MRILFAHTNFPAQFGAFGAWLGEQGWDVAFATARADARPPRRTRMFRFIEQVDGSPQTHRHARPLDRALRNAENFAAAALKARDQGLDPQIVVAHSGWGAGTYARAVWPDAAFIPYLEWWYRHPRVDRAHDEPEPAEPAGVAARAAARNAPTLVDLGQAQGALCPTAFQAAQFPDWLRARITVQPDGFDAAGLAPDPSARKRLAKYGPPDDAEIVTYATRGMEPYRGFPDFMRALERLQRERPRLHAIIVGEDRVAYGEKLPEGDSWRRRMEAELDLDPARTHFTGLLPKPDYETVLQGSDAHVYLTIPFVLSWSFIEAMSVGAPLIASDVAPVHEALGDSDGAALVAHHDIDALAGAIARTLDDPRAARERGARARRRVLEAYDRRWVWPAKAALLRDFVTS
jgi:glycosyltransferase involved in cell wall biosynthesis